MTATIVLLILALICWLLAAFSVSVHPRVNLIALGLVFWCITLLIPLI